MRFIQTAVLLGITILILSACSGSDKEMLEQDASKTESPKKVWTTKLVPASDGVKRHLTGTIQAADAVSISFEVAGVVSTMHVDLGQSFKKGDVLAELDKTLYQMAVQQNKSALGEATAALLDIKQTFERNKTLRQQGLVSQAALDSALASFDIAQQRVEVAESSLDIAKENLSDTTLIAPYSGRVSERFVEPSQQLSPGAPVLSIQGNALLEVNAAIPEGLINKVALLDQVSVVLPSLSSSKIYPATLTEIGAQASIANAFPITITFNDNHTGFYPGMSAEIILSISGLFDSDEYFEVPFSAFTTDKSGPYLYFIATSSERVVSEDNANKDTNKDTPIYKERATQEEHAIAEKHYIDIVELKLETAIIKFKQQPDINMLSEARIVKTGLDFIRPNQAISVVETSTQIYNQ
jgi:RND family efflux transporter MFP subunit